MRRLLKPVSSDNNRYIAFYQKALGVIFDEIYGPAFELLKDYEVVENSKSVVASALMSGRISFHRARFSGKFNAAISRELISLGAQFDVLNKEYVIYKDELPLDIQYAIFASKTRAQKTLDKIDKVLRDVDYNRIISKIDPSKYFEKCSKETNAELSKTLMGLNERQRLTKVDYAIIAEEYTENFTRSIKNFAEEEIVKLRETLSDQLLNGGRQKSFVESIGRSYAVSQSRARFIARQETALFTAKLKQVRYQNVGVKKYIWRCSHDGHKIRMDHLRLEGKTFAYDNPPITNRKTGARNNPSEDFNCYCDDIPIVEF